MVPGVPGLTGLNVPRAVVEELRPGGDSVTVQPRPRGGQTVRGINIRRDSATLRLVMAKSKVKVLLAHQCALCTVVIRNPNSGRILPREKSKFP